MSNISYCMYENTLNDLRACYRDMLSRTEDEQHEPLSHSEAGAQQDLINVCQQIIDLAEQMEDNELEQSQANMVELLTKVPMLVSAEVTLHPTLSDLPFSHGNIRFVLTDEWFIWRDTAHYFLSRVSDNRYYYQLESPDPAEEAYAVIEKDDQEGGEYGYAEQGKSFD